MKKKRKKIKFGNLNIEAILMNSARSACELGLISEAQRDREIDGILRTAKLIDEDKKKRR